MADYSDALASAEAALEAAASGNFVEEYQIGRGVQRVRRSNPLDQVNALAKLEGLAARRSGGGICRLAKFRRPRA